MEVFRKFGQPAEPALREPKIKSFAEYQQPDLRVNGQLEDWSIYPNPENAKAVSDKLKAKAKKLEDERAKRMRKRDDALAEAEKPAKRAKASGE